MREKIANLKAHPRVLDIFATKSSCKNMNAAATYEQIRALVTKPTTDAVVTGVEGLSKAHLVWQIAQTKSVIWVVPDSEAAEEVLMDLHYFAQENGRGQILHLPFEERTPYHATSPDPAVVMERSATLFKFCMGQQFQVLVLTPEALIRRHPSYEAFQEMVLWLVEGEDIDRDELTATLVAGGYTQVSLVEDVGTFAIRGSIIDIFWAGLPYPIRLDLFGDTIDRLTLFSPDNQRTVEKRDEIQIGPAREIMMTPAHCDRAIKQLRDLADEVEYPSKKLREKLHDLENRLPFFGAERLLPAFYDSLSTTEELLTQSYNHDNLLWVFEDPDTLMDQIKQRASLYDSLYGETLAKNDLVFPPETWLYHFEDFDALKNKKSHLQLKPWVAENTEPKPLSLKTQTTNDIRQEIMLQSTQADETGQNSILKPLVRRIQKAKQKGELIFLPTHSLGGVHRYKEMLQEAGVHLAVCQESPLWDSSDSLAAFRKGGVTVWTYVAKPSPPAQGGCLPQGCWVIPEADIFGKRTRRGTQTGKKQGFKTALSDLEPGDYVVHIDHGVGVFEGLTRLNVRGAEQDYLKLRYQDEDTFFLPVHRINQIQKYTVFKGKEPKLDKLGGTAWQSKKKKVKQAVVAMAQDLLALYAKRELIKRTPFSAPDQNYYAFESNFAFVPTPDQAKATEEVLKDLQSEQPMDRLICGDVGFGKTEVAMRAAMMVVLGNKQVGILAPTTVLAQQHYLSFKERFRKFPIRVEVVSRFKTQKEVKQTLKDTMDGKVDILVGTHRLISDDVDFKDLGLLIIDEEQRFGVKAKEKLKRLRAKVDVLVMSATPIPRTLQMGFFGVRDLSLIETPPPDRRAIRTSIVQFDDDVIREAVLRELNRNGQVFFVHNRVRSIYATADYLKQLLPEARIGVAHGQMPERELENMMLKFMNHEINVLLCTTIIETGIDVPSANTMFIDHAEDYGLSQLYQLRGRIGRSQARAFCYLMIPGKTTQLTPIARKRLEVLNRFSDLGAGFKVAQHDLELRGAGDLLGRNQHGHVASVGYDLYAELLKEAVEDLKGKGNIEIPDPEVNMPIAALLPDNYIQDLQERLSMYQRLATAEDGAAIYDVVEVIKDQYGQPPQEVLALAEIMLLKQRLKKICARGLEVGYPPHDEKAENPPPPRLVFVLGNQAKLNPATTMDWVQQKSDERKLTPQMKLVIAPTKALWEKHDYNLLSITRHHMDVVETLV